ncbi:MAG: hypothetical protein LBQ30_03800 [Treponema sp.]|jgi:hypothetical protein|nr:hypothetical protein [Treponema sp.]
MHNGSDGRRFYSADCTAGIFNQNKRHTRQYTIGFNAGGSYGKRGVDVVTAAIGISILLFLIKPPMAAALVDNGNDAKAGHTGIDYFRDLKEGLWYIRKHTFIFRPFRARML